MGFTKLDEDIFDSSLTTLGPVPFAVFVLLLAKAKPPDGIARVAPSVIAGRLLISREECLKAFEVLQAPDQESRTPSDDGRRIERVDGGWRVINYLKYREKRDPDVRKEQTREATRKWRDKKSKVSQSEPPVSRSEPRRAQAEAEEDPLVEVIRNAPRTSLSQESPVAALARREPIQAEELNWAKEACILWDQRFQGRGAYGKIGSDLKPLVLRHGWQLVRRAWIRYLAAAEATYASSSRFSQTFGKWADLAPDPPEKHDIAAHNIRAAQEAMDNPPDLSGLGTAVRSMPRFKP